MNDVPQTIRQAPRRRVGLHRPGLAAAARLWLMALTLAAVQLAIAQGSVAGTVAGAADPAVLRGAWKRTDGNYIILVRDVGTAGEITAMYFNPSPLPFAKAQTSREAGTLRAAFELQAGGYNGSTYELRYDATSDRLVGVYFQAVAKQRFEVSFVRQRIEGALR
ncbi:hypothetical protein [Variovorax sp. YR216]|uniref:hypothetical protein n=1 Tax=Variovorax sp. YR216 TaxID=1882828 RepID=UPI00089955BE|nr:hypothetical protein [Variovorax sp. YR216]SEB14278.1 hypothetical protein SAMN05444680_109128 [Variovorax sp. YR216]